MGARCDAPDLERVHDAFDLATCWRSGGSTGWDVAPHLIELMAELEAERIGIQSVTESIDTTTPGGKLVFPIFRALAKFERNFIRERTYAGLAAARARGRKGGRRKRLGETQRAVAVDLYRQEKHAIDEICKLSASQGRRFRSMSRRLATYDARSGSFAAERAEFAGYRLGASVLATVQSIRRKRTVPQGLTRPRHPTDARRPREPRVAPPLEPMPDSAFTSSPGTIILSQPGATEATHEATFRQENRLAVFPLSVYLSSLVLPSRSLNRHGYVPATQNCVCGLINSGEWRG